MTEHQSDPSSSAERRYRQYQPPDNRASSTDDVPLQHYKTRAMPLQQQLESNDDSRDDNICIGSILQRSATARRPTNEKPLVQLSQSKSLRSTSTSTGLSRRKRDPVAPPLPTPEDEELRFAMQRAWAVLDSDTQESKEAASTAPTTAPSEDYKSSNMVSTGRIQTVPLKTLTTRIYIDDANNHKVVQLSNLLTTAMVVQYLKKKGLLDHSDDWSLFEIDNQHGVERPLREWEIVLDVLSVWEPDASNALLVKKYSYHYTLTSESILQKKIPPMHGWLSIEYKKGKWQKRYCFIKDNAIHHAKDNKGSSSSILCHLATYDVYTLLQPIRISPSPFVFAIRAQDRSSIFEKESDYMRFLAVEDQEDMKDWVLSIRCTKSNIHYQYHPNRVAYPLAHISLESTLDDSQQPTTTANHTTARRHKFTRDLKSDDHTKHAVTTAPPSVPSLPRSESTRRIEQEGAKRALGRSGTTRGGAGHTRNPTTTAKNNADVENSTTTSTTTPADGPLIDCLGPPTFAKGSLLAKEEEAEQIQYRQQQQQLQQQQELMQRQQTQQQQQQQQQQQHEESSTLIQIDDSIKFAKGSLLDQKENGNVKMTRSKSVREVSSNHNSEESSSHRRHVSLRRKPTGGKRLQHHDVPLPNNAAIASLPISPPPAIPPSTASSMLNSNHNQNHTTLLQLNNNQERSHTRELHARHGKPLLNFDSPNTTSTTTRK
ncbi:uncharacterized protein ATC70_002670 [Mucor velutinosus]|uniref:PH domain-containing protein n=1 Tax=Mucor velutinosus TaxID=708070 RepID=A0AAN7HSY8_9FUNG|nr:hypothetical protein ATC70_002670 [Mucor velutinosus]